MEPFIDFGLFEVGAALGVAAAWKWMKRTVSRLRHGGAPPETAQPMGEQEGSRAYGE